jgi:dienelactone hydrolase
MRFELEINDGERIPAILDVPAATGRVPGVLLLHGLGSTKEQMAGSVGRALEASGVASLAVDLPLHGNRRSGTDILVARSPMEVVSQWQLALREADHALAHLASVDAVDSTRLGIAGYSLGAYLALEVAARNATVRAVVLAAGGDLPAGVPFAALVRSFVDPPRAATKLAGRPLLMVNGRHDRRVPSRLATVLFEAAHEPKELRWYEGGHWPPTIVIDEAARWLSDRLREPVEGESPVGARTVRTKAPKSS